MTMPRYVENHVVGFLVIYHGRQSTMALQKHGVIWGDRATSSDRKPTENRQGQQRAFSHRSPCFRLLDTVPAAMASVSSRTYVALTDDQPRLFTLCYASM
ncbi:hypothetical protein NCS52_01110000 [Fusarium sp. LHS14.1]|nr:hypothetical protein NCS52_01110000 [Fusarium sp. LHS14.1]